MDLTLPFSSSDATEAAKQAIRAYVAEAFEPGSLPPPLSEALRSGSVKLLDLVKLLGEYLTSEDERIRSKGVELLAHIVIDLAPVHADQREQESKHANLFDRQAVRTLTAFLAEKLEDGTNVATSIAKASNSADKVVPGSAPSYRFKAIPEGTEMLACSIKALTLLSRLDGFGSEQTKDVAAALISHVKPRDHPQTVRFLIYVLLDALISQHRHALKAMGTDFLKGYVDLAEGEKDPRNLFYLFAMDRVILIEWDLDADMAEAFFDITYCYFPITFRPPPDDPYGISTEDLKMALRSCLTANPLLAPHAMPLLLEKLVASGGNTKKDTLETLQAALPVFGKAAVLANDKKLWEGLKVEIMAATDEETSKCAQGALISFFRTLYHDQETPDGIAPWAVADALQELEEPEKSLAKPACEILVSMAKSCPSVASLATYAFLDQMLSMFKNPDAATIRGPILAHIATVLQGLREVYHGESTSAESERDASNGGLSYKFAAPASSTNNQPRNPILDAPSGQNVEMEQLRTYDGDRRPLDAVRDELLSALSSGVRSTQYRASALLAFVHLAHIPTFLSSAETNYIAESINDLILSPAAGDVRGAALDGLRDIAKINLRVLEETTLPLLFARLPDRLSVNNNTAAEANVKGVVRRVLSSLARLCVQPDLFKILLTRLSTRLDLVCVSSFTNSEDRELNVGYARGLLVTMLTVLEEKVSKSHKDVPGYGVSLPPRLFALVLAAALRHEGDKELSSVAADPRIIRDLGRLLTLLVRTVDVGEQKKLALWLNAAFCEGKIEGPLQDSYPMDEVPISREVFHPLNYKSPARHKDLVFAYASAIVPLQKDVDVCGSFPETLGDMLPQLLSFTLHASGELQIDGGFMFLASLFNKHLSDPMPAAVQTRLNEFWDNEVAVAGKGLERRTRAILAWFWITKALLVRNSKSGQVMLEQALNKFLVPTQDSVILAACKVAARSLGLIASEDDGVLNKANGATMRLLYRQKFYSHVLPKIITGHYSTSDGNIDTRGVYLIALSAILPSMPNQMITQRLEEIFPLLIKAMDLPDASARCSAATTITLAAALGKKEREEAIRHGSKNSEEAAELSGPNSLDLIQEHTHALVERLLTIARPVAQSPPAVRIAALRCLATLVQCLPSREVKAKQVRVLRALNGPDMGVDDPKKEVRTEAVDCKTAWHVSG